MSTSHPNNTRSAIASLLTRFAYTSQERIKLDLWYMYGIDVTQQDVSYHIRKLGALRGEHDMIWRIPDYARRQLKL